MITALPYFADLVPVTGDEYPACKVRINARFPGVVSLQFLRSGSCWFSFNGSQRRLLDRPAIFLHMPAETYRYSPGPTGSWHHYWASFRGSRAQRIIRLGFAPLMPHRYAFVHDASAFTDLFAHLVKLLRIPRPQSVPEIARILEEMLALLMSQTNPRAASDPRQRDLLAVADALQRQPFQRVDWQHVARDLHISESHFRRLFRAFVGVPPQAFLLKARMRHAARMLSQSSASVKHIALTAGYADPPQFTKLFRSVMGLSPTAYRQIYSAG